VLLLMPASVLVLLVLAAIAVDAAILMLGEREAADLAAAAANDAAVAAISRDALYGCGNLELDAAQAHLAVQRVVAARGSDAIDGVSAAVAGIQVVDGRPEVTVTASGTVRLIFTPAVPGFAMSQDVEATASSFPEVAGPDPLAVGTGACP
jgi:Flp pilus assembly protein TadG